MKTRFFLILGICLALPMGALAKPRIMVSELRAQGVPESLAQTLSDLVVYELSRANQADIVSNNDLTATLDLQAKQNILGCDEKCMVDMAKQLDCTHIVHGSLGKLGPQMILNLTTINIEDSNVLGRQSQILQGPGSDWLPAIQISAAQVLNLITKAPESDVHEDQDLLASLNNLRTAQRPKQWNLSLSTGVGYLFSGLDDAGLTQPLLMAQLSFDYSMKDWFLLGIEGNFVVNQGSVNPEIGSDDEVDVLLRGYYGALRTVFRKSTGLWMPYGGLSLGIGYIKISDDRNSDGNTSVLGGPREGRGNFGGLVRAYTGSQFLVSDEILIDIQLMIFQHLAGQSFEVEGPEGSTEPLYQGSWDKIKGAVFMVGVSWQN